MQVYKENLKLIFENAINTISKIHFSGKKIDEFILKELNKGKFDEIKEVEENLSLSGEVSKISLYNIQDQNNESSIANGKESLNKSDFSEKELIGSKKKENKNEEDKSSFFKDTKRKNRPSLQFLGRDEEDSTDKSTSLKKTYSFKNWRKDEDISDISSFNNLSPINIPKSGTDNSFPGSTSPIRKPKNDTKRSRKTDSKFKHRKRNLKNFSKIQENGKAEEKYLSGEKNGLFNSEFWQKRKKAIVSARVIKKRSNVNKGISKVDVNNFKTQMNQLKSFKVHKDLAKKSNRMSIHHKLIGTIEGEYKGVQKKRNKSVLGSLK